MKVSIIIPAFNEEKSIAKLIAKVKAVNLPIEKEIVVIDDGSTDATSYFLNNIKDIIVLTNQKNLGKGGAIKKAINTATGEILLIQDADLEYDPNDYKAVLKPILDGKTEIVNGVRTYAWRDKSQSLILALLIHLGNKIITWTTNILYLNNAAEYEGCYKAFTRSVYNLIHIQTNSFDFDNELICKLLKKGYKPIDVPISYYPRSYAAGKKISWYHGCRILWTIIKTRFAS